MRCVPENGKLPNPTSTQLANLAVTSAKNTQIERWLDGISYLIAARAAGIVTPLMADYEQEILKLTQTDSLEAALAKIAGAT